VLDAVIFIPLTDPSARQWAMMCFSHCARSGYTPVAVVHRWCDILQMILAGARPVVVVAKRDHIPGDRLPRIEVVSERPEPFRPASSQVRTRRM
jgi:hypothetical protein